MTAYFDTAYVAKCYVNEKDSAPVRRLLAKSGGGYSSSLCRVELAATLMRHVREASLSPPQAATLQRDFESDVASQVWTLISMTDAFLLRVGQRVISIAPGTYLRAGDAIHLCAAAEGGFAEIWSNDRHLLAAAPVFGLQGRSV